MGPNPPQPSRAGYILAAALLVLSVTVAAGGVIVTARAVSHRVETFQRVGVPGTAPLRFDAPGSYTIYYEAAGVGDEATGVTLPPVHLTLSRAETGAAVPLARYHGSFNYNIAGHDGVAVATLRVERAGRYQLRADATIEPGIAQVAVGRSLARGLAGTLLVALAALAAFVGGTVAAILTASRRQDARRTAEALV